MLRDALGQPPVGALAAPAIRTIRMVSEQELDKRMACASDPDVPRQDLGE